jgi:hypothetical protein
METWPSRQKAYPLIGLYVYVFACLPLESRKQPRTIDLLRSKGPHCTRFQTPYIKQKTFPPEGHTAIRSYCLCNDEDKTLSQGSKSVGIRIFRVLVQQCFPHAGMTSTCASCTSTSLVSYLVSQSVWLFVTLITSRQFEPYFFNLMPCHAADLPSPTLSAEVWTWVQVIISGIQMEKLIVRRLFLSLLFHQCSILIFHCLLLTLHNVRNWHIH